MIRQCLQSLIKSSSLLGACLTITIVCNAQTFQRISLGLVGTEANQSSNWQSISADGNIIVYNSRASNLVAGDTNNTSDIFVYDRRNGQTRRVNLASGGVEAVGCSSGGEAPSLSSDGRFVAYRSKCTNLVSNDNNNQADIFVTDLQTQTTVMANLTSIGGIPSGGLNDLDTLGLAGDGRLIAIGTLRALEPSDTNSSSDIYVRELNNGSLTRVGPGSRPQLSRNGQYLTFESGGQVFVLDRQSSTTRIVSAINGVTTAGNGFSFNGQTSNDGRWSIFVSTSTDLVLGASLLPNQFDIFLRDHGTNQTTQVASSTEEQFLPHTSISSDGEMLTFSASKILFQSMVDPSTSIYRYVRSNASLRRLVGGSCFCSQTQQPVSADGNVVAFSSTIDTLVPGDTNGVSDIFVRDDEKLLQNGFE
jgi:Tol biopolymer transport system component